MSERYNPRDPRAEHEAPPQLERLLRTYYDEAYDARSLLTPGEMWAGVAARLEYYGMAGQSRFGHASGDMRSSNALVADPDRGARVGGGVIPRQPSERDAARTRKRPFWLARGLPVIAAVLVVSLLVGVLVELGYHLHTGGAHSTQIHTLPHPCLQPAQQAQPLGMAVVSLASGDVVALRDGNVVWRDPGVTSANDLMTSEVIWNAVVYGGSRHNTITALRLSDGQLLWKKQFADAYPITDAPTFAIDCGVMLIDEAGGGVEAVRANDSARLWRYQDYTPPTTTSLYPFVNTPMLLAASNGITYIASQRAFGSGAQEKIIWSVKALRETDGVTLWNAQFDPPATPLSESKKAPIVSTPAPFGVAIYNGTVYVTDTLESNSTRLLALREADGTLLWRKSEQEIMGSYPQPAVNNGRLYVETDYSLCQVNPQDGAVVWYELESGLNFPFAIAGDAFYAPAYGTIPYPTETSVTIEAHRLSDRVRLWQWIAPEYGVQLMSVLVVENVVYTDSQQRVYAVDAQNGKLLWSWAPPHYGDLIQAVTVA